MNSKRTGIIIGVIILLLILAGLSFKFVPSLLKPSRLNNSTQDNSSENTNANSKNTAPKKSTLAQLMGLGKSSVCTFSINVGSKITGKTYVTSNKMRTDFDATTPEGQKISSSMIKDGDWLYSWTSASSQGVKMKVPATMESTKSTETNNGTGNNSYQNFDPNLEMNYDCKPWVVNNSMLTPPSNVTFMELNAPDLSPNSGSEY